MPAVLCAPLHIPQPNEIPRLMSRILDINKDLNGDLAAVGLTEAAYITPRLRNVNNKFTTIAEQDARDHKGQWDTTMLHNQDFRSKGSGQVFGCDQATPVKIAHERWFTYDILDNHFIINMHPHPAVQNDDYSGFRKDAASRNRVSMYIAQMQRLNDFIRFAKSISGRVTVTGDMNLTISNKEFWSPYNVMKRNGLKYIHSEGIVAMGTTLRSMKMQTIKGAATDHDWILGKY